MSNAVVRLPDNIPEQTPEKRPNSGYDNIPEQTPEKRPNCGYDNMPEQTPEKRFKIVDSAMKLQSVGKGMQYCMICGCNTDHSHRECPNYSKGMGMACDICFEPCEIKEHEDKLELILKFCSRCGARGNHWSKDCPSPIYDDDDMYF